MQAGGRSCCATDVEPRLRTGLNEPGYNHPNSSVPLWPGSLTPVSLHHGVSVVKKFYGAKRSKLFTTCPPLVFAPPATVASTVREKENDKEERERSDGRL